MLRQENATPTTETNTLIENEGRVWEWIENTFPEGLIQFFENEFYHNTAFEWIFSIGIIAITIVFSRLLFWIFNRIAKRLAKRTKTQLDDILIDKLEEPFILGVIIIGAWWGIETLHLPGGVQNFANNMFHILIAIDVTWLVVRTVDALLVQYLVPKVEASKGTLDAQLMPLVRKSLRFIIWAIGIIAGLNNAGYDVGAMLAGLGIGGIAMAMAAKDFVANIFGGVSVFLDKPFTVNDRIQVGGYDGVVTEIGIRSTRMRTLAGRLITVPNHKFTDSFVENVSAEPSRKVSLNLGLTYDTTPEQIEKGVEILHNIVDEIDEIEDDRIIQFNSFGDFSLGILFIFYIRKESDLAETNHMVHMAILKRFNAEGLEFAFPTQTVIAQVNS